MTDRTWKQLQYILIQMANEDPNEFLNYLYRSGMDSEDIQEMAYIVEIARRARGYDAKKDMLRIKRII